MTWVNVYISGKFKPNVLMSKVLYASFQVQKKVKSCLMYKKQNFNGTSASLLFYHPPSKRNFPNPSNKTLQLKTHVSVCLCICQGGEYMYNQAHVNQRLMSIKNKINFPWLSQIIPAEREDVISERWNQTDVREPTWNNESEAEDRLYQLTLKIMQRSSPLFHKKLMKLTCSSQ